MIKSIILFFLIISCSICYSQIQIQKEVKQRYLIYEDTGFCFVSGPHLMCSFVSSNEKNLEAAVKNNSYLQYLFISNEDFKDYYAEPNLLIDTIKSYKSKVAYFMGSGKFNSIDYYKVRVKIKIPIENFYYKTPKKNEYTQYKLSYKNYLSKLYCLTNGIAPVFECIEFEILSH